MLLSGVIMIMKAYQFRLYPTKEQEVIIRKTFGCTRFVYNYCLDLKKKNKYLTKFDLMKELPKLKKEYSLSTNDNKKGICFLVKLFISSFRISSEKSKKR